MLKELSEKAGNAIAVHYVSLDDLVDSFLKGNSKKHDTDKLIDSIQRYGFRDPIAFDSTLNNGEGGIIEGNGRLAALLEMREKEMNLPKGLAKDWQVPVLFGVDAASEAEAVAFSVEHNWSVMWGIEDLDLDFATSMFDDEALKEQLEWLDAENSLPISVGDDIDDLINRLDLDGTEKADSEIIEDEIPEDVETRVKRGDIWQLGKHRLYCGDSTDEEKIKEFLGDRVPTFIWSDPPYGMNLQADFGWSRGNEKMGIKPSKGYANVVGDDEDFDPTFFLELFKDIKEQFWWGADYYLDKLPNYGKLGSFICWDKKNDSLEKVWTNEFEMCWSKTKHKKSVIRVLWNGALGTESEDVKNRIHPNQKPLRVAEKIFDWHGDKNDVIFDPFLGSGMSLITAEKMKGDRAVYGVEILPEYCSVVLQRWENFTGLKAELLKSL